jgi:hypothetical protein
VARRDPNHQPAIYALGKALQADHQPEAAQQFLERSKKLQQLLIAVRTYQISQPESAVREACRLTQELGLAWECWGWHEILAKMRPLTAAELAVQTAALDAARRESDERTVSQQRLAERYDYASYPLPGARPTSGIVAAGQPGKKTSRNDTSTAVAASPRAAAARATAIQFAKQRH